MIAKELEEVLSKLLHEIVTIKTNWSIWNGLIENFKEGSEYMVLLGYSPCFWSVTLNNLLSKTLLGTAKIYDEHRQCMGVLKIINICEQNKKIFPKEHINTYTNSQTKEQIIDTIPVNIGDALQTAKQNYKNLQMAKEQLIKLRNKHLAHTDKNIFMDPSAFYQEVSLKKESLEALINTAADIVNSFLTILSNKAIHTEYENSDDYKNVLFYVKEGKDAYLQKIKSN